MMMKVLPLLVLFCYHTKAVLHTNEVIPACPHRAKVCKLPKLTVRTQLSMACYNNTRKTGFRAFVGDKGRMYYKDNCTSPVKIPLLEKEADTINAVDGTFRYITTINGRFPGPTLVVYEGQQVEVTFVNKFQQQGMGVHFHGQSQRCTNWMDGVPGINQCAFNMGESFTYNFTADPVGTHWYHSHYGFQRIDGLYGAFIVLPKPGSSQTSGKHRSFHKDFVMAIQEFYPLDNNHMFTSLYEGLYSLRTYLYYAQCPGPVRCTGRGGDGIDGTPTGPYEFYSALVNGKGRRYQKSGDLDLVPLETYKVKKGKFYNFRLLNTGSTFSFNVSIDQHKLVVTRTEVGPIKPVEVDNIIINVAERYEFYIETNQRVDNYWIRIDTLEVPTPHFTRAILRYDGARKNTEPKSRRKVCTKSDKCRVLGCPYLLVPPLSDTSECINIYQLESPQGYTVTPVQTETMLHFSFTNRKSGDDMASINGILFDPPTVPPSVLGYTKYDNPCGKKEQHCDIACRCTHQIKIPFNDTVQHTFFSTNSSHPIHTHGYWFHVLKIGYPTYDENNKVLEMTKDIVCLDDPTICNNATWADPSWSGGNIPGLNLKNPVVKDTLTIPTGGYVVVRFVANNTGWWFMHCHIDPHFGEGMAMIQQVGDLEQMVPAPPTMHLCGDVTERELKKSSRKKKRLLKLIRNMKSPIRPSGVKKYTKLENARLIDKCKP